MYRSLRGQYENAATELQFKPHVSTYLFKPRSNADLNIVAMERQLTVDSRPLGDETRDIMLLCSFEIHINKHYKEELEI